MNNKINIAVIVSLVLTLFTFAVQAAGKGFYWGAQLGVSRINAPQETLNNCLTDPTEIAHFGGVGPCETRTISPSTNGAAGRAFLGYNFNDYFALETGYGYFSPATYNIEICPRKGNCGNPTIRASAIDVVGKLFYTFCKTIGAFVKGGAAVTYYRVSGSLDNGGFTCGGPGQSQCSSTQKRTQVRGTYGAGISYDLTDNWVTDLSYTVITGSGTSPKIDFLALGISYHFVDVYCGQFLC